MNFNSMVIGTALLLAASSAALAADAVQCPPVSNIQQAVTKLDSVMLLEDNVSNDNNRYAVYSSAPAFYTEGGYGWVVGSVKVFADTEEHAREKGIRMIQYTIYSNNETAEDLNGQGLVCYYGPAPVFAVAPYQSNTINFSKLG